MLAQGESVTAIEVKSGRVKSLKGLTAFVNLVPHARTWWSARVNAHSKRFSTATCRCFSVWTPEALFEGDPSFARGFGETNRARRGFGVGGVRKGRNPDASRETSVRARAWLAEVLRGGVRDDMRRDLAVERDLDALDLDDEVAGSSDTTVTCAPSTKPRFSR